MPEQRAELISAVFSLATHDKHESRSKGGSLMGYEDLKATDNLCQRDRAVILPFLYGFDIVYVDNEILLLALVVDFGLRSVSARHLGNVGETIT